MPDLYQPILREYIVANEIGKKEFDKNYIEALNNIRDLICMNSNDPNLVALYETANKEKITQLEKIADYATIVFGSLDKSIKLLSYLELQLLEKDTREIIDKISKFLNNKPEKEERNLLNYPESSFRLINHILGDNNHNYYVTTAYYPRESRITPKITLEAMINHVIFVLNTVLYCIDMNNNIVDTLKDLGISKDKNSIKKQIETLEGCVSFLEELDWTKTSLGYIYWANIFLDRDKDKLFTRMNWAINNFLKSIKD